MDGIRAALMSLRTLFLGLPRLQQVAIVGAAVAAVAVLGGLFLFAQQPDFQKDIETQMARQIQEMLEKAVGPNKALVRVNAQLNWDQISQDSEFFVPPSTVPDARPNVVRSSQTTSERFAGPPAALPVGVPGVPSNVGPGAPAAASLTTQTAPVAYEKGETITNYEISKTVEKLTK